MSCAEAELLPGATEAEASLGIPHNPVPDTLNFLGIYGSWELYQNGDLIPEVMLS